MTAPFIAGAGTLKKWKDSPLPQQNFLKSFTVFAGSALELEKAVLLSQRGLHPTALEEQVWGVAWAFVVLERPAGDSDAQKESWVPGLQPLVTSSKAERLP